MLRFGKQATFELGVVVYEMCAGEHPFEHVAADAPYSVDELALLPVTHGYTPEFNGFLRSLVAFDPGMHDADSPSLSSFSASLSVLCR